MARKKRPFPTVYLEEKADLLEKYILALSLDEARDAKTNITLTQIIHNANSIVLEAKKWQTQIRTQA